MDVRKGVLVGSLVSLLAIVISLTIDRWMKDAEEDLPGRPQGDHLPHVLFFLVDDLGYNDVSWNNPDVKTHVLQQLAEQGVILDQFYSQPVCTPSRVALLTGKYPYHVGSQHGVIWSPMPICAALGHRLLPEYLKDQGYDTYMAGKWHLGHCNRKCTPTSRGFDHFAGFYQGAGDHYTHSIVSGYDWHKNDEVDYDGKGVYSTELITQRVVSMLRDHDLSHPSFTYVSYAAIHTPLQAPQKYMDIHSNVSDENRKTVLAMMSAVDDSVGTIIDTLKERGMYDNTVIIFASDNGAEFIGIPTGGSNVPLRGAKMSLYEGATRVPAFVTGPRLSVTRGQRQQGLFHITDWFSTILSLAGVDLPSVVDGVDQSEMLFHGGSSKREEFVYNIDTTRPVAFYGESAIRVGDYKLISGYPGRTDGWQADDTLCLPEKVGFLLDEDGEKRAKVKVKVDPKKTLLSYYLDLNNAESVGPYANALKDNIMLFNLREDPEERNNLASERPQKAKELMARLAELMTSLVPAVLPTREMMTTLRPPVNDTGAWSHGWC